MKRSCVKKITAALPSEIIVFKEIFPKLPLLALTSSKPKTTYQKLTEHIRTQHHIPIQAENVKQMPGLQNQYRIQANLNFGIQGQMFKMSYRSLLVKVGKHYFEKKKKKESAQINYPS